ncbi:MAG TPA: acetyl-CoA carboxylase carboxyltransferase subunit alpha [Phycisphaerae bacterium]|nr:acetyl-CoA carboxylase carboxyltransferase subunit alpha [Phycisphaerae bacterium]
MAKNPSPPSYSLEFEKPILQLEKELANLVTLQETKDADYASEINGLRTHLTALLKKTYQNLSAWETVQVARHPARPQTRDYIDMIVKDFDEVHGDRTFGDDKTIVTGMGRIGGHKCMIVGHHKGRDTKEKIACNFGCAHPEGYRKALAKMQFAEKFNLPIVTFIDTPGAYPGIGSEERGVAEAIAVNLREMARLKTPIVCIVIGEGGSGGALGIGVGDRLAMLQYAWYSVISPEGCSGILWKGPANAADAAEALKLTSKYLKDLGIIDEVIEEPLGAAHRNPRAAADNIEKYIDKTLRELKRLPLEKLVDARYDRLRNLGTDAVAAT